MRIPGLVSATDLADYQDLFVTADSRGKARLVGCIAGWMCEEINANKIVAYGLEDVIDLIDPGSGAALFADLEAAYARGDAWLGYIWGPTQPTATLDLYRLEGARVDPGLLGRRSGLRVSELRSADRGQYEPDRSRARGDHVPTRLGLLSRATGRHRDLDGREQRDARRGRIWYLRNNRDVWSQFIPADVAERVDAALAEES